MLQLVLCLHGGGASHEVFEPKCRNSKWFGQVAQQAVSSCTQCLKNRKALEDDNAAGLCGVVVLQGFSVLQALRAAANGLLGNLAKPLRVPALRLKHLVASAAAVKADRKSTRLNSSQIPLSRMP